MVRRELVRKWQRLWDGDDKGRSYYRVQRSVRAGSVRLGNRMDEVRMARMRMDHTGLRKTMKLIGKVGSAECPVCGVVEGVEHVLMSCGRYRVERERLKVGVAAAGREWTLEGLLGRVGKGVMVVQKAVIRFLKDTGLYRRI